MTRAVVLRSGLEWANKFRINWSDPEGITKFMLKSAEHKIFNDNKYKNIKKLSFFSGSEKPEMPFFLLLNVKMPTIVVGSLTFMSRKNFMFS